MENTACANQGFIYSVKLYDWSKIPDRKGKRLCCACGPTTFNDGTPTKFGKWHNVFTRTFLPLGMFETNKEGNLSHVETGDTDYMKYEVSSPEFILNELNRGDLKPRPNEPLI